MIIKIIKVAVLFLSFHSCYGQSLPRKVFLGIRMEEITEDSRRIMEVGFDNGVLITEVFARSTAEAAGFKRGDILLALDEISVSSTTEVINYLKDKSPGEGFAWKIYRNKEKITGNATLQSLPEEQYNGLEMVYTQARTPLGEQRMIISKPITSSKLPVILFIGGIGCYSLDFPFDSSRSEVQLLNNLSRRGFLCARAEKPGMGDNVNTKTCAEVSFTEEMEGYIAMIDALKRRPDVDSNAIYIFGHSMGGVFAPLIAQRTRVKGIIAYGTIGSNFLEYLMKTRKTIAEAYGMTPENSDELVKNYCECAVYYFADKMTSGEVEKKKPGCKELVSIFDLRSRAYNQELYSFNIPALWKSYNGKALLLWGTADYIASQDDHEMIAAAINYYHPGNAAVKTVQNADHGMLTAQNFAAAKNNPGIYNQEVTEAVWNWLKTIK